MYKINDRVVVPADAVRFPAYPHGFIGQIITLEDYPAEPGEVWVMLAVVVDGRIAQARLAPIPLNLDPAPRDSLVGPPFGYRRRWTVAT